ncbi:MAG: sugar ABC transporter substrate-binding protein [Elusimicrobiota bacterium]
MKNLLKIVAVAAVAGAFIFVIFFGKKDFGDKIVIRWAVDPSPSRPTEIAGFEKENPGIKVELASGTGSNTIMVQIAGNLPPDIFTIYDPATLRIFMEKGALLDIGPYMKKYDVDVKDFWPPLRTYMYSEGKMYGVAANCGPFVVFYNKDMFDAKGLKYPDASWTWKELLEAAQKLTDIEESKKEYRQFGILTDDPMLFIWQNGGRLFSEDGTKCVINSKQAKEGLRFYYDLRFMHHVMPKPQEMQNLAATGGWGGTLNLFAARKVAMFIQGRWMSMVFRKDKRLNWDIAPVPKGKYKVTMLASHIYAIPRNCLHVEEAVKFLVYQVSRNNQLIIANSGDGIPARISIGKSKEFLYDPEYPNEKNNKVYIDEMAYARVPEFSMYCDATQVSRAWYEELDRMNIGLQSSDETCDRIAERVNKLLKERSQNAGK